LAAAEAKVAQWKRELVDELVKKLETYPVVGILDLSDVPASQFQQMRQQLEGKAEIKVARRILFGIAIEQASEKNPKLRELIKHLRGQIALIFTSMNPFKLWKFLDENKASAPAKPGRPVPKDITIPAGETDFPPGPIIGELQRVGLKARIQAGKIVILDDCTLLKEGDTVSVEVAEVLSRFGIQPREIGFNILAAFDGSVVYPGDVLVVDDEKVRGQLQMAYVSSLNLSLEVDYPTSANIRLLIGRASLHVYNLAMDASYPTKEVMSQLLGRAGVEMLGLASLVASKNAEALDEELKSKVAPRPAEAKKEEKETKKEAEEKPEKGEEKEETAGLGALFG
jgi:large subunit ribosomal protein L10